MTGRGKRARAAGSKAGSDQPSSSKQKKTDSADWCADCWSAAEDACRGGHRLVDRAATEKELQAELTAANREVARLQERLAPLTAACVVQGPVLKVSVDGDDGEDGSYIEGGDMHITMAVSTSLTAKEKKAVCAALENVNIEYKMKGPESVLAYGNLKVGALDGVLKKLPDCVVGQAVRKGAVLLSAGGRLEVYFRDMPSRERSKVFGQVRSGQLDALEGRGCDGDCERFNLDCFCREGGAGSTTLSEVEFVK